MQAVFLDQQTFSDTISFDAIKAEVSELVCYPTTPAEQVISRCQHAEIIITNKVVLDQNILAQLPKLKLICIAATGYNNIDINAAKELGIAVTNVSGYAGQSVAQYVFAQILNYYQNIQSHNANTKKGLWQKSATFCLHGNAIKELAGKTLAIIGYGNLGKAVENIAKAFAMKVMISERPSASTIRNGRTSFNEAIKKADIISLHCPQTPETENLINADVLLEMKNTAMLINTARGALVNSKDLLHALKNKQIAFAALDVLEQEPPANDHPLLQSNLDNLVISAHIAWASSEAQQRLIALLANNIAAFNNQQSLNRLDLLD